MVSQIITATTEGIDSHVITTEVDLVLSLPSIIIVGLPDVAVSEAKERIRTAIKNSGFSFPNKKVVINLAPADIKKEGTSFDLPMAVGILAEDGIINPLKFGETAFIGELSLDGSLRAVNGILPLVAGLAKNSIKNVIIPFDNAKEAALVSGINVLPAKHLSDIVYHFSEDEEVRKKIEPFKINVDDYLRENNSRKFEFDFKDVKGQQKAKKALEIAAAGGHNLLMCGSPGSGKTLLAKCFQSILPPLELSEAIELTKIYSVSGLLEKSNPLMNKRPFRAPHHSASAVGIIGGGSNPKPGEITLAHRGVLFLDEIVEFPRNVLEVLRQPLEDGEVVISRANASVKYPADFMLLATMNPCPCGFFGDKTKNCTCNEFQINRYRSRLSGPLLDRIDMQIEVARIPEEDLLNIKNDNAESSETIRKRVIKAREMQIERYKNDDILYNSQLTPALIKKYVILDKETESLFKAAVAKFALSGRSFDRILRLTRTIADLNLSEEIKSTHLAQALQYRSNTFLNN